MRDVLLNKEKQIKDLSTDKERLRVEIGQADDRTTRFQTHLDEIYKLSEEEKRKNQAEMKKVEEKAERSSEEVLRFQSELMKKDNEVK